MELGLFTSGYQRYPLEQAFEDASRFGYDYIELWGGYPHAYVEDLTARGVGEIDRLIQKYRMPVKCFTRSIMAILLITWPETNFSGSDQWCI